MTPERLKLLRELASEVTAVDSYHVEELFEHIDVLTAEVAALRSKLQEFSNEAHKLFVRSANSLVTPESLAEMLREAPLSKEPSR